MRDLMLPAICRNMIFIVNSHINGLEGRGGGGGGVKKQQQQKDRCYFNSEEAAENRGLRPEPIGSNKEQAHDPSSYTLSVSKTLANNCFAGGTV